MTHHQYYTDDQPIHSYFLDESTNTIGSNYGPPSGNSPPSLYPYHPYYLYDGFNSSSSPSGYLNTVGNLSYGTVSGGGIANSCSPVDPVTDENGYIDSDFIEAKPSTDLPLAISDTFTTSSVSSSSSSSIFYLFNDEGQTISYNAHHHQYYTEEQPAPHPYFLEESTTSFGNNFVPPAGNICPPSLCPYHPYYLYDGYNSSSSSSGYLNTSGNSNLSSSYNNTDGGGTIFNGCNINDPSAGGNGYMATEFIETKPSTDLPLAIVDNFTTSVSSSSSGACSQTLSTSSASSSNTAPAEQQQPQSTNMTTTNSVTTSTTTTTKNRRKKKEPVDYVLLDVNSAGDEKTEFIKYVGKGSYKCQICDIYSKNNKDYIQDHINIKHYNIKKNYECLLCHITFAWRSGAFKHLKKYHSIEGKSTINFFRAISKRHVYHSQRKRK